MLNRSMKSHKSRLSQVVSQAAGHVLTIAWARIIIAWARIIFAWDALLLRGDAL